MEHERTANALLLFYEKVRPRGSPHDDTKAMEVAEGSVDKEDGTGGGGSGGGDENAAPVVNSQLPSKTGEKPSVTGDGGATTDGSLKRVSDPTCHPTDNMSTSTESDLEGCAGEEKSPALLAEGRGRRAAGKSGRGKGGAPPLLDGIEAFSEEVWQANVQFMLNSYVFDTEFHHFLRRVNFGAVRGRGYK